MIGASIVWGINAMSPSTIQAIAWIALLALAVVIVWGMARENERKRNRTDAEYERDLARSRGSSLSAGAMGLEKIFVAGQKAAIEYQEDERGGMTRTGGKSDEPSSAEDEPRWMAPQAEGRSEQAPKESGAEK